VEEKHKTIIYKGTKYTLNRGYYKTTYGLHRRIWEDHFGEIPLDHHIHHKNGDSTDNKIENLECIHKKEHHSMHFSAIRQVEAMQRKESRDKANEWYRSEEGGKFLSGASKKGWVEREPVERICVICSTKFHTKNLNGTKYCSQSCRSRSQMLKKVSPKNCSVCGNTFTPADSRNLGKTCSQKCKGVLISATKRGVPIDLIPTINR